MTRDLYPWHESNWRLLQQARSSGRLPHALLFVGIAGLGKRMFAELLARSLLCARPDPRGLACGVCRSCHFFAVGNHPDFLCLEPEAEGRPIRVDAIREFAAWSVMTAQEGANRVTLLLPADSMNPAAANSLLKTLEEPVRGNHIILVTSRPSLLPATVRSRCQKLTFVSPAMQEGEAWLASQAPGDDWTALLRLAQGAPLMALELAQGGALAIRRDRFAELEALVEARADPIAVAAAWADDPHRTLGWLGSWIRDIARLHARAGAELLENPDLAVSLQSLGDRIDLRALFRLLDRVDSGARIWHRANLNLQMQMEDILIALVEGEP